MFSLELHATFLISSYLLLMFSISMGIFYVSVGILTPCGYSVYLWTQVVLILPSYGLSLCYLTLFPVTNDLVWSSMPNSLSASFDYLVACCVHLYEPLCMPLVF